MSRKQEIVYDGGQARNMKCGCGWSRRGSPREVQNLFFLHRRHCKQCGPLLNPKDVVKHFDMVSFKIFVYVSNNLFL